MKIKLTALVPAVLLTLPFLLGGCMGEVNQTNESLTIFFEPQAREFISSAVQSFRRDYPDIAFSIYDPTNGDETMSEEQIRTKLNTEMMSGNSTADLFVQSCFYGGDGRCAPIKSGAYCDLNPFLENDPLYNPEDYHQDILAAGVYRGKQYVMPLNYSQDILLGSESALKEAGFDISCCTTAEGFKQEAERYLSQPDSVPLWYYNYSADLVSFMPGLIDQREGKAYLLEDKYRPWHEFLKMSYQKEEERGIGDSMGPFQAIREGKALFMPIQSVGYTMMRVFFVDDPVFLPILNADGTQTANIGYYAGISNTSPNQENAYHFLSYLMRGGCQSSRFMKNNPVQKDAKAGIRASYELGIGEVMYDLGGGQIPYFEERITPKLPPEIYEKAWEATCFTPRTAILAGNESFSEIYKYMQPFYDGTASYEECVKKAQEQMEIYLSE